MRKRSDDNQELIIDDEKKFNLSIKQLTFIQSDNNIKTMNNIIKLMKKHLLNIEDVNDIIEKHALNEQKKIEKNDARKINKLQNQSKPSLLSSTLNTGKINSNNNSIFKLKTGTAKKTNDDVSSGSETDKSQCSSSESDKNIKSNNNSSNKQRVIRKK